jgi:hypothetical protein
MMPALKINQLFGSLRDFKESLRIWALTEHVDYRWALATPYEPKLYVLIARALLRYAATGMVIRTLPGLQYLLAITIA